MHKIKLFATDVDGTLTNGCMYYGDDGTEFKRFNFRDGMAFQLLHQVGIKTAILTTEQSVIVEKRANKLKVDFLIMNVWDKLSAMRSICRKSGISLQDVAFIGDDINDKALLESVGVKACPQDAAKEIKQISGIHILCSKGGEGAVRELANMVIDGEDCGSIAKPWGSFRIVGRTNKSLIKIIDVNPHAKLSLQSHSCRSERWTVLEGKAEIVVGNETASLKEGETVLIPKRVKHRLINNSKKYLVVLESSFGNKISEEDIIRYEDDYGRVHSEEK